MLDAAKRAAARAHCPYSQFPVGAVVCDEHGTLYNGCNVENASYGLTCCAERNAIFNMIAGGGTEVRGVVIYTPTPTPTAPCGACRQVLNEFGPTAKVLSYCDSLEMIETRVDGLLPVAFGPKNLA